MSSIPYTKLCKALQLVCADAAYVHNIARKIESILGVNTSVTRTGKGHYIKIPKPELSINQIKRLSDLGVDSLQAEDMRFKIFVPRQE